MLHILLTILKILGILILVILGVLLTVIAVVLFVPIRYQGDVSFDGKPKAGVLVSWLLRIIRIRVNYDEEGLNILAKILWFKVFEQTPEKDDSQSEEKLVESMEKQ